MPGARRPEPPSFRAGDSLGHRPEPKVGRRPNPLRVALIYTAFGALWIVVSDRAVEWLFVGQTTLLVAQTLKGLVYIGATAALVYWLARRTVHYAERKHAEQQLRSAQDLLEIVLSSLGEAVIVADPASRRILQCNPAAGQVFGVPLEELIGQSMESLFPDTDAFGAISAAARPALEQGEVYHTECRLKRMDGSLFEAELTVSGLRKNLGWRRGVVSVIRDVSARKRAEETLRESEARFRHLVELLPVAVYVCDRDGAIVQHNQAAVALWGQDPVALEPPPRICGAYRLLTQEGQPLAHEDCPMALTLRSGEAVRSAELVFERPDGSRATAIVNTVPVFSAAGALEGAINCLLDVTALKAAQDDARRAHKTSRDLFACLRQLVAGIPDAVYIKDRELRYLLINEAGAAQVGLRPEDAVGLFDRQLFDEETAGRIARNDREIMDSKSVRTLEEVNTDHHGRSRHFVSTKGALLDSDGQTDGLYGISHDVTEARQLRKALEERVKEIRTLYEATKLLAQLDWPIEQRLRAVVEILPEGWLYPEITEARIQFEDSTFATTGFRETPWMQSSPICCFQKQAGQIDIILLDERPERVEGPFLAEERALLDNLARAVGEAAERKRLEERYYQAQKLESVGRLAGGIAHDFNNLLSIILGCTQMALNELSPDSPARPELDHILDAGERAADLTRQLLAFSRQEVIRPIAIDLNKTVGNLMTMLSRIVSEDVKLIWEPCPEPLVVRLDPSQTQQILVNLVVNARDAIAGAGSITIAAARRTLDEAYCAEHGELLPGEYASLSVLDSGSGMDRATIEKIFEPFFTTKPEGQGTGLGLATVYGIIKQNGGRIEVNSEPGLGTVFSILLPRLDEAAVLRVEPEPGPGLGRGTETILLVEDEQQLLALNARALEGMGYRVLPASYPEAALEIARTFPEQIDVVMTDIVMPQMNGRDLFEHLITIRPGLKCLYTSGYSADLIADGGVLKEDIHFLQKPFTRKMLAAKLREVIDR